MEAAKLKEGACFLIDGGDGDQSFFSSIHVMKYVSELGFPRNTKFGDALLFVIEEGQFAGRRVVLTSRATQSIAEQIDQYRFASVIVFLLIEAAPFNDGVMEEYSVGMSFIRPLEK